jgi:hypothetical protein
MLRHERGHGKQHRLHTEIVKQIVDSCKLTQREIAEKLRVSEKTIWRWIEGKTCLNDCEVTRFARALNDAQTLIHGHVEPVTALTIVRAIRNPRFLFGAFMADLIENGIRATWRLTHLQEYGAGWQGMGDPILPFCKRFRGDHADTRYFEAILGIASVKSIALHKVKPIWSGYEVFSSIRLRHLESQQSDTFKCHIDLRLNSDELLKAVVVSFSDRRRLAQFYCG